MCRCGQARLAASSHSSGEAALGWGSVECENLKLNFKSKNIQRITFSRTRLEKPINGGIFSKECQKGKDMNSLYREVICKFNQVGDFKALLFVCSHPVSGQLLPSLAIYRLNV